MTMRKRGKTFRKQSINVTFMIDGLREYAGVPIEEINAGSRDVRLVTESNLHRPGLVLAGYLDHFTFHRIQILGNSESQYLQHMPEEDRQRAFLNLIEFEIPCIILTSNNQLDPSLVELAREREVPIFRTSMPSTDLMAVLRDFLNDQFALQQSIHGSLVDVYGIGMLMIGKSGIRKSEVALDLVERGHRLVADDVVIMTRKEEQVIMGSGTELVQHFMEVRGLGLVDVRAMFGIRAIRFQKRVEVVVYMHEWDQNEEYTRLGMVDDTYDVLDVHLPLVKLPIMPGKNITVICEVIAMNHLLRHYGYDPAEVFSKRLADQIRAKSSPLPRRGTEYFEHDYE